MMPPVRCSSAETWVGLGTAIVPVRRAPFTPSSPPHPQLGSVDPGCGGGLGGGPLSKQPRSRQPVSESIRAALLGRTDHLKGPPPQPSPTRGGTCIDGGLPFAGRASEGVSASSDPAGTTDCGCFLDVPLPTLPSGGGSVFLQTNQFGGDVGYLGFAGGSRSTNLKTWAMISSACLPVGAHASCHAQLGQLPVVAVSDLRGGDAGTGWRTRFKRPLTTCRLALSEPALGR